MLKTQGRQSGGFIWAFAPHFPFTVSCYKSRISLPSPL